MRYYTNALQSDEGYRYPAHCQDLDLGKVRHTSTTTFSQYQTRLISKVILNYGHAWISDT